MLRNDKTIHLSLLLKVILSETLSNSLYGLDVLLFSELINIVCTLYYTVLYCFTLS